MSLTDEQKRMRAEAFGASEAPTLVGVGPGKLSELWQAKIDPSFDAIPDEDQNDLIDLGTEYEDPVCRIYARRTGTRLARVATLRHPTKSLAVATPDRARFTSDDALQAARALGVNDLGHLTSAEAVTGNADRLVEAKTTGSRYRRDYGRAGSGVVPEEKALQCIWQMGVTGLRVVDLPVLFMGEWGRRIEVFTVTWNEDLFEWMYAAAERFWHDHVVPKTPPPPDGSDAYDEMQARIYPYDRKPLAPADAEDEQLMLDFAKFREVERRAELLKKKVGQRLKNRIGEAGGLLSPTLGKLSWTRSKDSTEVDWQRAAQEALALAGQCVNAFDVLAKTGEQLSPHNRATLEARLKEIVPAATKVKSGYRSLRLYPKGDAELELARLNIALDALGDGT